MNGITGEPPKCEAVESSACNESCKYMFGHCLEHAEAIRDGRGDFVVGDDPRDRWARHMTMDEDRPPPLYITTINNPYVCIEEWDNEKGIRWWRGSYRTKDLATLNSVGYDTQRAGNHKGGTMFGVKNVRLYVVGVGSRVWNY